MAQSNYIAAALAIAFLVYITARGSLKNYLAILTGEGGFSSDNAPTETPNAQSAEPSPENGAGSGPSNTIKKFLQGDFNPASILDSVEMFGG